MRLLLVRHGESTWNVEGRYQGRLDPPLSPRGQAQAQALAARLYREQLALVDKNRIAAIVSSPLTRTRTTAQICAEGLGLNVGLDERLIEISHGEWEGKLREEIACRWPDIVAQWRTTPQTVRFPRGETLDEVRLRFESFLSAQQGDNGLLVTTHDVVVRIAILHAQGKPLSECNTMRVDNAALNEFAFEDGKLTPIRINDTTHLGSLLSETTSQAL